MLWARAPPARPVVGGFFARLPTRRSIAGHGMGAMPPAPVRRSTSIDRRTLPGPIGDRRDPRSASERSASLTRCIRWHTRGLARRSRLAPTSTPIFCAFALDLACQALAELSGLDAALLGAAVLAHRHALLA